MNFYVVLYKAKNNADKVYPCITLVQNNWDDYGHKTLFTMWYNRGENDRYKIGPIKIISKDSARYDPNGYVILDPVFTKLDSEYCSLGQETSYYQNVSKYFGDESVNLLESLNDVAIHSGILDNFEDESSFTSSLIRFSEAEKALKRGLNIIRNEEYAENFDFEFSCHIGESDSEHVANFSFRNNSDLPERIMAIVGGNGVGKTQYLSQLALAISGENMNGRFTPSRPLFNKIIAVSYSAFDKFKRPKKGKSFSYKYCGLKDDNGFINAKKLETIYKSSCDRLEKKNRVFIWHTVLSNIIDENILNGIHEELFVDKVYSNVAKNSKGILSSGQNILMYVVTEILANIREDSLILFDEPEMHLHPNAISKLIIMMNQILDKFDSYAVLATHSPIILQEIPSKNVMVFERFGNTPNVRNLSIESFGENLSTITKDVFETVNTTQNYKFILKNLSDKKTFDEVSEIFDNRLSLNAEIYLKSCYKNEES